MEIHEALQEMIEAVSLEKKKVKSALGALQQVVNLEARDGRLKIKEPGANVYKFDSDLELQIPEGTQIQIRVPGCTSSGEVIDHDFDKGMLTILLREEIGNIVPVAQINFDSSFLFDSLSSRLTEIQKLVNDDFVNLGLSRQVYEEKQRCIDLAFRFLKGESTSRAAEKYTSSHISHTQEKAVGFLLNQEIGYLWGPPGTGKTRTISELVYAKLAKNERICLTAHTNVATDTVLQKVLERDKFPKYSVLRIGYCNDEIKKFDISLDEATNEIIQNRHPGLYQKITKYIIRVLDSVVGKQDSLLSEKISISRRLSIALELINSAEKSGINHLMSEGEELVSKLNDIETDIVNKARLVSTTLTRLYCTKILKNQIFDTLIIDEASIASLVISFVSACCSKKHVIAAGDFRQLPPITKMKHTKVHKWLGNHVFTFAKCNSVEKEHHLRFMLDEQWRMHPQIAKVVSSEFYGGRLKTAKDVKANVKSKNAILVIDTSGSNAKTNTQSGSKHNHVHASIVTELISKTSVRNIGIIAPYRSQVRLIRNYIRESAGKDIESGEIEVFTVHKFQGRDKEIIIFDLVEAPGTRAGFLSERTNNSAPNLINVAISRAKSKLIIIANLTHVRLNIGEESCVYKVLWKCIDEGDEVEWGNPADSYLVNQFMGDTP